MASNQEQRKAWRGVGQRWLDGGYLSVTDLNTFASAIVALGDEVEGKEKTLRAVRERLSREPLFSNNCNCGRCIAATDAIALIDTELSE